MDGARYEDALALFDRHVHPEPAAVRPLARRRDGAPVAAAPRGRRRRRPHLARGGRLGSARRRTRRASTRSTTCTLRWRWRWPGREKSMTELARAWPKPRGHRRRAAGSRAEVGVPLAHGHRVVRARTVRGSDRRHRAGARHRASVRRQPRAARSPHADADRGGGPRRRQRARDGITRRSGACTSRRAHGASGCGRAPRTEPFEPRAPA